MVRLNPGACTLKTSQICNVWILWLTSVTGITPVTGGNSVQ